VLKLQTEECSSRIGFIHVPTSSSASPGHRFSTILFHLLSISGLSMTEPGHLLSLLDELDRKTDNVDDTWRAWSENAGAPPPGSPLNAFTSQGWEVADDAAAAKFWALGTDIAEKLGLRDGRPHLLVNGRVSLVESWSGLYSLR
jgi:UDP-glucose:glycoprotein glucosyltransferase